MYTETVPSGQATAPFVEPKKDGCMSTPASSEPPWLVGPETSEQGVTVIDCWFAAG